MQNTIQLRCGGKIVEAHISCNASTDETRKYKTDGWYAAVGSKTITHGHETREACIAALRASDDRGDSHG